jgi:hypothetical protein
MMVVRPFIRAARKAVQRRLRARRHKPAPYSLLRLLRLLLALERAMPARVGPSPTSRWALRLRWIPRTRT